MPMFVHNFTSYFHEKQRDLYFVTFSQVKKGPLGLPDVQDYWNVSTVALTVPENLCSIR